jgi:hypothetical protein
MILYLASRVLVGMWKKRMSTGTSMLVVPPKGGVEQSSHNYCAQLVRVLPRPDRFVSALTFGLLMMLFEESPHVLNRSLKSSLDDIYRFNYLQSSSSKSNSDAVKA